MLLVEWDLCLFTVRDDAKKRYDITNGGSQAAQDIHFSILVKSVAWLSALVQDGLP